jgi:hypothetical protein
MRAKLYLPLLLAAALGATGCFGKAGLNLKPPEVAAPLPTPASAAAPVGTAAFLQALRARPAPAEVSTADLRQRIADDKALGQIAKADGTACRQENWDRALARYGAILNWCGAGAVLLAAAAFFLLWLVWPKDFSRAWHVASVIAASAPLFFFLAWLIVHVWSAIAVIGAILVGAVVVTLLGKWRQARSMLEAAIRGVRDFATAHGTQHPAVLEVKTAIQDRASAAGVLGPLDATVQRLDPADA